MSYAGWRHAFAELLDPRQWPIEWLDQEIREGRATAFGDEHGCIVVALRRYPGGAVEIHGLGAVGEMGRIVRLIADAERWGREHGATLATISSRRGWARKLQDAGYVEAQVLIEKEL